MRIALIYSSEAGRREATLTFDVGQGTQDLGFRAEVPVLFTVRPAVAVKLASSTTTARRRRAGFSSSTRRATCFRRRPSGWRRISFSRSTSIARTARPCCCRRASSRCSTAAGRSTAGSQRAVTIPAPGRHGAVPRGNRRASSSAGSIRRRAGSTAAIITSTPPGCAHYTLPTEGVDPADMFRQVKGEGLNVGSVLTWGPGFDHQQQFFAPTADTLSEPRTLMKYDIEVSGFGSEALGQSACSI